VLDEIESIDGRTIDAIIECCKELCRDGIPFGEWCKEKLMEHFDKAFDQMF
jgi:hypothetical protein